jgi:hypothetical protein
MFLNLDKVGFDSKIYRIISLEKLLELFVTGENCLVKPAIWEDVFENFILKSKVRLSSGEEREYNFYDRMYGQCWTLHKSSDAMWRIYSPTQTGLRIRTTIKKLHDSLYDYVPEPKNPKCCIGKVRYLNDKSLTEAANSTFDESGIGVNQIFESLLLKRRAFQHENEIRILYDEFDDEAYLKDLFRYPIDPHLLIDQIMIDPRRSYEEFQTLSQIIRTTTGFKGPIKRSLLYTLPKRTVVDATDIFSEMRKGT